MPHREYLVPFKLLEDKMRLIGCELLTGDELKEVGMVNSSATFDVSWEMAKKKGTTFKMIDPVKQFSFMNRWFIFKRKRQETLAAAAVAEALSVGQPAGNKAAGNKPAGNKAVGNKAVGNKPAGANEEANQGANQVVKANAGRSAAARQKANAVAEAATAIQNQGQGQNQAQNQGQGQAQNQGQGQAQGQAQALLRTVGVAPGPAAAPTKSYTLGEVFQFYMDAATSKDQLGMKPPDKGAARWLAPGSPFPIKDGAVEYPSMEHYVAGMRAKRATNKPELAETIFSREGTIHQRFLQDRLGQTNGGAKQFSEE
jgi:hypothetical protein